MRDCDLAIIGGGPAGLTAAYEARKQGLFPVVLERTPFMGGIARTVRYRGYRFDIGGHRFFTKVPRVRTLWNELLGTELLWRPRMSRIYYQETFLSYPLKPLDALLKLGPLESVACVTSLLASKLRPLDDETRFDHWVINRFGQRLFDTFFRSYTEKVWGVPCRRIRSEWAAQRIKTLSLSGAIMNAFFKSGEHTSLIERFQYPRLGPGQMWETCRDRIREAGGRVLTDMRVTGLKHDGRRVHELTAMDPEGNPMTLSAESFISSMPLGELVLGLTPQAPPEVRGAARRLPYRDFILVALIIDREEMFPDNWIYIHSPRVKVGRIQNFKNWSPDLVPDQSTTCLGMEYFCFEGDETWRRPDEELIASAGRELREIGLLPADARIVDGHVARMRKTYPSYVGETFPRDLAMIRSFVRTLENLTCCGRNGQHRYNNQDHSMLTACLAVENILGADHDVWNVNVERVYHETVDGVEREASRPRPSRPEPS